MKTDGVVALGQPRAVNMLPFPGVLRSRGAEEPSRIPSHAPKASRRNVNARVPDQNGPRTPQRFEEHLVANTNLEDQDERFQDNQCASSYNSESATRRILVPRASKSWSRKGDSMAYHVWFTRVLYLCFEYGVTFAITHEPCDSESECSLR